MIKKTEKGRSMRSIYLDHAATTPLDTEIFQKMTPYFTENYGNADSPHALGRKAMGAVDTARDTLAALLNAKPSEIFFTSGGTEGDNWAILGCARAQKELGKDHVIVSAIEHHAALAAAETLEREGFAVTYLPVNNKGEVETETLERAMTEKTGLVAVMSVNNETGVIQPIKELAKIAKTGGAVFFTDGVQAAPYMEIDVKDLGVDMLSLSSHKFYGPKGCGALYIRSGVKVKGLIVGGEQERGLRGGTTNVPAVVGLAAAYKKARAEMAENNAKIERLRNVFIEALSSLDGLKINAESENKLAAVLNIRVDGVLNSDLVYNLDLQGVCIAAGSACASASIKPSHVLTAMGMTEQEVKESVRVSFGKNNTEEEVRTAARLWIETVNRLRGA